MASARAAILLTAFLGSALLLMPLQGVAVRFGLQASKGIPVRYHRFLCRIIGIRVHVKGAPYGHGPVLIAANHTSWLDIPVLSTVMPVSFVAKSEVAGWPFFGWLAKLQETVFVERERRSKTAHSRNQIHARLARGDRLILFPEGTSSDGNRVLPFKSALMSVAQLGLVHSESDLEGEVIVQPLSVAYTHLHGIPMGRQYRPFFAWYGDMELFPHLWQAFKLGPIDVMLEYHDPITIKDVGNRKALAAYCEVQCRAGVARALLGRHDEAPEFAPVDEKPGVHAAAA